MHSIHFKHLSAADKAALALLAATPDATFEELGMLALSIVKRHGGPLHMVSGPITSGGFGSREENYKVFCGMIEHLADVERLDIFSIRPFEDVLVRFWHEWNARQTDPTLYCYDLLNGFYRPVFASGCIDTVHFMHGYESSTGARWEYAGCPAWGIKRRMLGLEVSQAVHAQLSNLVPVRSER